MATSKLSVKLKNAPGDTPLVSCSARKQLNREETLSAAPKVRADNIGEEDQLCSNTERQDLRVPVYVVNMRGRPLMPTTPRKARVLLKMKKAKVVTRSPFTIQLMYPTGETTQPVTLGIDPGYGNTGFSAVSNTQELMAGQLQLRQDVSLKLTERRMYRRNRRSRLWYRKPRFKNRKRSKPQGWLAPSLQHKLETHLRLIEKIKNLLPISKVIIEVATFDTHKMQQPEIEGIEYQQGTLQGYEVREYLLEKWNRKCAYCGKTDIPLEVEHVVPKQPRRGEPQGTDRVDNLTLACRACNKAKSNRQPQDWLKRLKSSKRKIDHQRAQGLKHVLKQLKQSLRATPFMNVVRKSLAARIHADITFGYLTKFQRIQLGLDKSHINDAFVIAGGNATLHRVQPFVVHQIRRNNRCLQLNRKGFKRSIRKQRYPFQPNDLVQVKGDYSLYRVKGTHCKGKRVLLTKLHSDQKSQSISTTKLELLTYGKGLQFTISVQE